ncbi:T9SS type A sorting domain-containing protein [Salibacter halophilus]|uniref:T9SS type A sorting domain-containing protein n=1 Tax=Salibacter halophilus TaxID=1803916 RepID=A0A6N6M6G0_9FLAO|nr:T9SS type A sorting domain-containing protein [Salibacter halophilus]KAB1065484.1 T9SS type A sorting domain-containing protein [Salibacter halophilus]
MKTSKYFIVLSLLIYLIPINIYSQSVQFIDDIPTSKKTVELVKLKGDTVFCQGNFNQLYDVVQSSQGKVSLSPLMSTGDFYMVDLLSKQAQGFNLNIAGSVWDFEVNDSLIFIGGAIAEVNRISHRNFALYNYITDSLITDIPQFNGIVFDLELKGDSLFMSGSFTGGPQHNVKSLAIWDFSNDTLIEPFNLHKYGELDCDENHCILSGQIYNANGTQFDDYFFFNQRTTQIEQGLTDTFQYEYPYKTRYLNDPRALIQFEKGEDDLWPYIKIDYSDNQLNHSRKLLLTHNDCDNCWGIKEVVSNDKVGLAVGAFNKIGPFYSQNNYDFDNKNFGNMVLFYHDSGYVKLRKQIRPIAFTDSRSADINDKYAAIGSYVSYNQFDPSNEYDFARALEVYKIDNLRPSLIGPLNRTICRNDSNIQVNFKLTGSDQYSISVSSDDSMAIHNNDYQLNSSSSDIYTLNVNAFDSAKTVRFKFEIQYGQGQTYNRFFEVKVKEIPQTPTLSFTNDTLFSSTDSLQHIWYTQNGEFTGYDLPFIYHPDDNYTFKVRSIGENGCLSNFSNSVFVSGRENIEKKNAVNIFPNPNDGNFSIENNADVDIINVYDATGKTVYSQKINSKRQKISTNLSPGIYFLVSKSANNSTNKSKLIITE